MNYYYNGKKPSTGLKFASGCFLIIAIIAIIFFFYFISSLENLEGHYLEIFFICAMSGSIIYGFFKKKGKLHTHRIEIRNEDLLINDFKIPLKDITLDVYNINNNFSRYHLWDLEGILSIYSVFEDDLLNDFKNTFLKNIKKHEETSSSQNGATIYLKSKDNQFSYDLESGEFKIKKKGKTIFNKIPNFYIYDPKYKRGKSLFKKQ